MQGSQDTLLPPDGKPPLPRIYTSSPKPPIAPVATHTSNLPLNASDLALTPKQLAVATGAPTPLSIFERSPSENAFRRATTSPRTMYGTHDRSPLAAHALSPTHQHSFMSTSRPPTEGGLKTPRPSHKGHGGKSKGQGSLVNDVVVGIVNAVIVRMLLMH